MVDLSQFARSLELDLTFVRVMLAKLESGGLSAGMRAKGKGHRPFSVPRETEPKPFSELQDISRKRFAAMIATTQTRGFPAGGRT